MHLLVLGQSLIATGQGGNVELFADTGGPALHSHFPDQFQGATGTGEVVARELDGHDLSRHVGFLAADLEGCAHGLLPALILQLGVTSQTQGVEAVLAELLEVGWGKLVSHDISLREGTVTHPRKD